MKHEIEIIEFEGKWHLSHGNAVSADGWDGYEEAREAVKNEERIIAEQEAGGHDENWYDDKSDIIWQP